jgi:hypothetical protein
VDPEGHKLNQILRYSARQYRDCYFSDQGPGRISRDCQNKPSAPIRPVGCMGYKDKSEKCQWPFSQL